MPMSLVEVRPSLIFLRRAPERKPRTEWGSQRAIFAFGAVLAAAAALIRSWAEAYLHSSVVHDSELHSDKLVASGPYRHVRNPLYLGNILLAVGIGTMASRVGFVVLGGGMYLFIYRLILREEAGLLASQGEGYRRYFEAVPRLWPSLRPRIPAAAGRPNWMDGFAGEIFMWGCAGGMAVYVATMRLGWFWIAMSAGFAVYFLQTVARRRPTSRISG
jgi:protein-S-isoprenylcysteine O-methyltransferase Ste14